MFDQNDAFIGMMSVKECTMLLLLSSRPPAAPRKVMKGVADQALPADTESMAVDLTDITWRDRLQ